MRLIGTVIRITHVSPHGGVIFRLRPDDSPQTLRVKADYDVLNDAPGIGDRLFVQGSLGVGHYGRQLLATEVMPEQANRTSVHALLLENSAFNCIPTRAKRRLSVQLGSQLLAALDNGDSAFIVEVGVEFDVAIDVVTAWLDYSRTIAARRFLLERGFSQKTTAMAVNLWGIDTIDVVRRNPYCLLAVAPWEEVDMIATGVFHCATDDERRYRGVAHAIFNEAASRGRAALFASEFKQTVEARIGSDVDTDAIVAAGIQAQRLRVVKNGRNQYLQGATLARFEAQIQAQLAHFRTVNASLSQPLHKRGQLSVIEGLREKLSSLLASNGIVLLNMPGAAAIIVDDLVQAIPGEVIVIAPTLAFARPPLNKARMCRLGEFIKEGTAPNVAGKVVVVQEASMLDLLTARKLLRSISAAAKLVMIGDRKMLPAFGPGHIFPGLMRHDEIASIDATKLFQSSLLPTPLAGLPAQLTTNASLPSIARLAKHLIVNSMQELVTGALAQYRAVFEECPLDAILIASTRSLATSLNEIQHREVLDYFVSQGGDSVTISLQNKQTATVGDHVVFTSRDFSRGLLHGSRGLVIDIFPNTARGKRRNPSAVARIDFDTTGPLEVTARDCQSLMLAHAVQVHHASLSRWRKVVIAAAPSKNLNSSWVWRSATRAVEELVILELSHAFSDKLRTAVRDTAYVPLSDWRST